MGFEAAPLVILAFCIMLILAGSMILLRSQWLLAWLKGSAGLLLVALAVWFSLYALNLFSYHGLEREQPLATVSIRALGPQRFVATVSDQNSSTDYPLDGDLWELHARVIQWKGLFALFGVRPAYRLDQIGSRYLNLEDQLGRDSSRHTINSEALGIDVWQSARDGWSLMLAPAYPAARFLPMADGAQYALYLSGNTLSGRPMNGVAEQAMGRWE